MWIPATHTQTHRRHVRCINEQSSEPAADVTFIPAIEPLIITRSATGALPEMHGLIMNTGILFHLEKSY